MVGTIINDFNTDSEMKRFLIEVGSVLAIVLLSFVAVAQGVWDELATRSEDRTIDRDVIQITTDKRYTSLKLTVEQGTVNIYKTTLHYNSGDAEDVKFPEVISKNSGNNTVNLTGNKGVIEKITFWYDTKNSTEEKAVVKIWARK